MDKQPQAVKDAITKDDADALKKLITDDPKLTSDPSNLNVLLRKVCSDNRIKCLELLAGLDGVTLTDDHGWHAVYCESFDTFMYCIEHGVTIESIEKKFGSSLFGVLADRSMAAGIRAYVQKKGMPSRDVLLQSAWVASMIKLFMEEFGITKDELQPENGLSALHYACNVNSESAIDYLIERGFDPNWIAEVPNVTGVKEPATPLKYLVQGRQFGVTINLPYDPQAHSRAMKNYLQLPNFNIDLVHEPTGNNLLHMVATCLDKDSIKLVITAGGDLKAKNKEGKTPAELSKYDKVIQLFKAFASGKMKQRRKRTAEEAELDTEEAEAKRAKKADDPVFHTILNPRLVEWTYHLEEEEDDDDTGTGRSDKGERPLTQAIVGDIEGLEGEGPTLARKLAQTLQGAQYSSECDCSYFPFVITVPQKKSKLGMAAVIKAAIRAPKAKLKASKLAGSNYFQDYETNEAQYKAASKEMKEALNTLNEVRFPEEAVSYPVFWCGKLNATTVVGVFAIRVDT